MPPIRYDTGVVLVRNRTALALWIGLTLLLAGAPGVDVARAEQPEISDDLLYDRVNQALITDRELGSRQLAVKVTDGVVSVTGFVETEKQKKKVDKVVRKVKGVKDVRNQVTIRPY